MMFWFFVLCGALASVLVAIGVRSEIQFRRDCKTWKEKHWAIHHKREIPK